MKKKKGETNAQRRETERKRRAIRAMASWIIWKIRRKQNPVEQWREQPDQPAIMKAIAVCFDKQMISSEALVASESDENIAKALRLAADRFEGKATVDGRKFSAHDDQIAIAWATACSLAHDEHPFRVGTLPTFSQFLDVYRYVCPGTKVEGRTLRRSLERLQASLAPAKRGRPMRK